MEKLGIASASIYRPGFRLDDALAQTVGAPHEMRLAAPDEDSLTMAWEAISGLSLRTADDCARLLIAAPSDGLEPRAVSAHLHATRAVPTSLPTLALDGTTDAPEFLGMAAACMPGTLAVLVDRERPDDPLTTPVGDCSLALVTGEPHIAQICGFRSLPTLSFDRWSESDERMDRDARFIEERVVAREAARVITDLLEEAGDIRDRLVGVVATVPAALKAARLTRRWDVPSVVIPAAAGVEPGHSRADSLATALEMLAAQGPGSAVIILSIGWGASGVLLEAGPQIGELAIQRRSPSSTQVYDYRTWTLAHRPPYTANPWTSGSELTREADRLLGLTATRCAACEAVEFPPSAVCQQCGGWETSEVPLTAHGRVVTHSIDELYGGPGSTVQMVAVALDSGGRFFGQAVQGIDPWLTVDESCRLVLRRLHTGSGLPHYFWKVDRDV